MSRAATVARVQEAKVQVMGLASLEGIAEAPEVRELVMRAAVALETAGKWVEARAGRAGTQCAPPARPGQAEQPDFRERQLPRGDR